MDTNIVMERFHALRDRLTRDPTDAEFEQDLRLLRDLREWVRDSFSCARLGDEGLVEYYYSMEIVWFDDIGTDEYRSLVAIR